MLNWRDVKNPSAGGAEIVVDNLIEGIRHGNSITFFTSCFKGAKAHESSGSVETIRRGSIFTVYVHAFVYMLRHRHEFDAIIESVSTVPFFAPLLFSKTSIIIPHHFMGRRVFGELPPHKAVIAYIAEKLIPLLYKKSEFITESISAADALERMHVSRSRISVAHPSVSFRYECIYAHKGAKARKFSTPTIITVSRLMRYKRLDMLIRLFSEVSKKLNARLIVVGSGREMHKLVELAKELNVQNLVEFKGAVPERKKISYLKRSWVFATASSMEGFGISALEAEKSASPVVAFGVGGIAEAVKDKYSGFVVKEGDSFAYISRLCDLLSNGRLRTKMSSNAYKYSKNFTWYEISNAVMAILKEKHKQTGLRRAQTRGKPRNLGSIIVL